MTVEPLPLVVSRGVAEWSAGAVCSVDDGGCVTCGDVAVELTVVAVGEYDAWCCDERGGGEVVATELVGDVVVGDRLLVHAKVALERIPDREGEAGAVR